MDNNNDQEMSLTLKYLLENPALLQPPEPTNKDKCKEDKLTDPQNDLTSAYLGPQIWSDMLLSDELKLEPVDLGDLLDGTGMEGEMNDVDLLMSNCTSQSTTQQRQTSDDLSLLGYQDMPSLIDVEDTNATQVPSPTDYFASKHGAFQQQSQQAPSQHMQPQVMRQNSLSVQCTAQSQPLHLLKQQIFDQQCALFNEVMANNPPQNHSSQPQVQQQRQTTPPLQQISFSIANQQSVPHVAPQIRRDVTVNQQQQQQQQHHQNVESRPQQQKNSQVQAPHTCPKTNALSYEKKGSSPNYESISSPTCFEVRIPSPKKVNFLPSTADVILATPRVDEGDEVIFDPTTRHFTEEELKPQPIVRKSRKVYVPPDNKDTKYWSRRNKNNVAAKRSREARRIKENQIALRANFLEQENSTLKIEISELRQELSRVTEVVRKYEKCFKKPS
ncbi:unnamed protein product [Clavelina lepadiformis]|uniref:BZIP domain-containing protein n=1 Tax=Clavelina lepadiformis TaxID=159417 RepID=A0ABP0FVL6_CLALP